MIFPDQLAESGSESGHQKAVFCWIALNCRKQFVALNKAFAIPNGGLRSKVTASRMKAEGAKSGVPDIFMPIGRPPFHGLFIEMKVGKNKPSDAQLEVMAGLREEGYATVVCWSWQDAIDAMLRYAYGTPFHGGSV